MSDDAKRWDAKYQDAKWDVVPACDPFVLRTLDELGPSAGRRALDVAAGTGRHALELAARGFAVSAWDVSAVGLERLDAAASERGLAVSTQVLDLTGSLPEETFDLIIVVNYLDRALLSWLAEHLTPGGRLVFTTFTADCPDGPSARHSLTPGELASGVQGLVTLAHEEAAGRAGLVAGLAPAHD